MQDFLQLSISIMLIFTAKYSDALKAVQMFWLHLWGALLSAIFILDGQSYIQYVYFNK